MASTIIKISNIKSTLRGRDDGLIEIEILLLNNFLKI